MKTKSINHYDHNHVNRAAVFSFPVIFFLLILGACLVAWHIYHVQSADTIQSIETIR